MKSRERLAEALHSTLRRADYGSPRTELCSKAHLHYNRSYRRGARAADWRLALRLQHALQSSLNRHSQIYKGVQAALEIENGVQSMPICT